MRYLLDTTVIIPFLVGDQKATDLVSRLTADGVAVSILSYLEAYQGVIEASDPEAARRAFNKLFVTIPVLPVRPADARRCAALRAMLKKQGKNPRRRGFDLVIAATALEHGLELVTHNTRDFADIPGLALLHP